MANSLTVIRILVVDDYEPFMRFVRATLQERSELQVIAEIADGLQAVQKAAALKPDLILLDIGLPTLSGIEAARQIRNVSPKSKIIFLTLESSTDVVQEALSFGARGYVLKTRAAMDLLAAVEAVIEGGHFVSGGLSDVNFTDSSSRPQAHY
jgi:DNA-binding NarL/FixJ family response regulator